MKTFNFPLVSLNVLLVLLVSINLTAQCGFADFCEDITEFQTLPTAPTDVDCEAFVTTSLLSCLEGANVAPDSIGCSASSNPTVWIAIETDSLTENLITSIVPAGSWTPTWSVYYGSCDGLIQLNETSEAGDPILCGMGANAYQVSTEGTLINTFYVAITALGDVDNPEFTINAYTIVDCPVCFDEPGNCDPTAEFTVTNRDSGLPIDSNGDGLAGPFLPGETVTIAVDYFYNSSNTSSDWLMALIPTFGSGWDMELSDIPNQFFFGEFEWIAQDGSECSPLITEQMPALCTYFDNYGVLQLCNVYCEPCPCSAPLLAESPIPSGWFWLTDGPCDNDCAPQNNYGWPGTMQQINFELDLVVKDFNFFAGCLDKNDLRFSFQPLSDAVAGCWNDPFAECTIGKKQLGPEWKVDCQSLCPSLDPRFRCACSEIDSGAWNVFCKPELLDGYTVSMNDQLSPEAPNPLCSAGGTPDNMTWFAFNAPIGDFDLEIIPSECSPGNNDLVGIEAGIYGSCDFTEEIWCASDVCSTSPISTANDEIEWIPGKTYYCFVDGCGGSVCELEFKVTCNSDSCDEILLDTSLIDIQIEDCEGNVVSEVCNNGTYKLSVLGYDDSDLDVVWYIQKPQGGFPPQIVGDGREIDFVFDQNGDFGLMPLISITQCVPIQITRNVSADLKQVEFPNLIGCEGSTVIPDDLEIDSMIFAWPSSIEVPPYTVGGDNFHIITVLDTVECNCIVSNQVRIEVRPNAFSSDTLYVSESDLPFVYNGVDIVEPVDGLNIVLEQQAQNGCDSIISLTVLLSTSVLDYANNAIELYPNPTKGVLHVECQLEDDPVRIDFYGINGRHFRTLPFADLIDLSDLATGVYLLKITDQNGHTHHKKVVKE